MDEDKLQLRRISGHQTAIIAFKPGVQGILVKHRILDAQLELISEHGTPSTRVHNHANRGTGLLISNRKMDAWSSRFREIHILHPHSFVDGRPKMVSMLEEKQVELAAIDMEGVVAVHACLCAFAKANSRVAVVVVSGEIISDVINVNFLFLRC